MKWLNKILASDSLRLNLNILYGEYEGRKKVIKFTAWKRKIILLITLSIICVSVILSICQSNRNEQVQFIKRNESGKGDKNVTLIADIGNTGKSEKINVNVEEIKYTDDQLNSYLDEAEKILPKAILGENDSADEISNDLNLIKNLNDYPFNISWKSEKPMLLNSSGKIDKKKIKEELEVSKEKNIPVRLCATLNYEDFICDLYFYVKLTNERTITRESFLEDMKEEIKKESEVTKTDEYQRLPDCVDGIKIRYKQYNPNNVGLVIVIGITCVVCLCISKDKEIEKQIHFRTEQMNRDYPKILNQYALYYCAGMNHRGIWKEICQRYEQKNYSKKEKRYAYEEMLVTLRELDEGVGEIKAYESFAIRCANVNYRAFINLIEQSVKKGGNRLDVILEEEIHKAYQEENNRVRMSAQEMTTKLLIPMVMMLVIVLVIVMIPAFMSINK